jgi:hypothetical protein
LLFLVFLFFTAQTIFYTFATLKPATKLSLSLKPSTTQGPCSLAPHSHSHTQRQQTTTQQWILTGVPFANSIFPSPGR